LKEVREEVLRALREFLETVGSHAKDYMAAVKNSGVQSLFNKFYGELASRSKVSDTVLERIYELLGVLSEVHPAEMVDQAGPLFRIYLGELKTQAHLNRYAVPLAGLRLLARHAASGPFGPLLAQRHATLWPTLWRWSGHRSHTEAGRCGQAATEAVLKQGDRHTRSGEGAGRTPLARPPARPGRRSSSTSSRPAGSTARVDAVQGTTPTTTTTTEEVGGDDSAYILPSFLQALASVVDALDEIPECQLPLLQRLLLLQMESVALYSQRLAHIASRALVLLLLALSRKGTQYHSLLQAVVHQSLVNFCSKRFPLPTEGGEAPQSGGPGRGDAESAAPTTTSTTTTTTRTTMGEEVEEEVEWEVEAEEEVAEAAAEDSGSAGVGGVGGAVRRLERRLSHVDHLHLWQSLLSCTQFQASDAPGDASSLRSLQHLLYDLLISSVVDVALKLDLSTRPRAESTAHGETRQEVAASSDVAADLVAVNPADHGALHNLGNFCWAVLLPASPRVTAAPPSRPPPLLAAFVRWLPVLCRRLLVPLCTAHPLVGTAYRLMALALVNARTAGYFQGPLKEEEKRSTFNLLLGFCKEVCQRLRQYKDELLACALTCVLATPHHLVARDPHPFVQPLQCGGCT
ncbi:DNA-dependent protein kinase catalytic subunit, partial [Lampetra planeri]